MRVKNRLDPAHDAAASGGYRDVGLNLRLDSDKTRQLGVDGHVCEVQLLLLQFAEIRVRPTPLLLPALSRLVLNSFL